MDLNYHSMGCPAEGSEGEQLSSIRFGSGAAGGADGTAQKQGIYKKMRENYRVMASCIQPGSAPDLKSRQAASLVEMPIACALL